MLTFSNLISFVRLPLAFLFLQQNSQLRALAILLAMLTDAVDGYLARKSKSTSKFGAILDPVMDKLFVYFVLSIFIIEKDLNLWQVFSILSRDVALFIFAVYLTASLKWGKVHWQAFFWGKISTVCQFLLLLVLTFKVPIPFFIYLVFIVFGILTLRDLFKKSLN